MIREDEVEYAGFWVRVGASLIDGLLLMVITLPLIYMIYGAEYWTVESTQIVMGTADAVINYLFPFVAVVALWVYKAGTPGKLVLGITVVDAKTGKNLTPMQAVGRYFAYIVAMLPLMVGIFWVGWDKKKQGWHDKLASTVVIRRKNHIEKVSFESESSR